VLADRAISVPFRARRHRFATVNHGHSRPSDLGALYDRCAAARMVRMGSPACPFCCLSRHFLGLRATGTSHRPISTRTLLGLARLVSGQYDSAQRLGSAEATGRFA
jgi:hypothetical protein